jgi:cytochrome P450
MLMRIHSVAQDNYEHAKTGLVEDEIVAQTGIIMAAGQDTTAT